MKIEKISLVGNSLEELINICESYGNKKFRAEQLFNWIYKNNIDDFRSFNNIPKDLINCL